MGIRALLRSGRAPVEAPVAAPEGTLMGTDGGFRVVVDDRGGVRPAGVGHGPQSAILKFLVKDNLEFARREVYLPE